MEAANASLLKRLNERTVLEAIRAGHPISRAEVARRTGMSKPTASVALQALLDAGLVREASERVYPHYGAVYYEPAFEAAHVLGFDLGARFLRAGVSDLGGAVQARRDVEVTGLDAQEILQRARVVRDELLAEAGIAPEDVDGAVVGVPGVVEEGRRVALGANIPGLDGVTTEEVETLLGVPLGLENDINLAAVGEQWRGVGRSVASFAFVSIGTGIGAGLVLDGTLHRGRNGAAGEMEFAADSSIDVNPCAPGIAAYAERLRAEGTLRTGLSAPFDPPRVFDAARRGDPLATEVVAEEARRIARFISAIAAVTDVELVVLGGGIGANGDLLLEPVRNVLGRRLPYPPTVEVSELGESAVLMGALSLALQAALDNVADRRVAQPTP
jgi:predicted NBD/HSP70 family sugar kinase